MNASNSPNRQPSSARPSSPQRAAPAPRRQLSPTRVGSVYPALENLQRISHGHAPLPPPATGSGGNTAAIPFVTAPGVTGGHYVRHNPGASRHSPPSVQHTQGPAMVSHQVLPTYRQVSLSAEGTTPSGHPSTGSESSPGLESSLPDILHSHMVPPVPPARPNQHRQHRNRNRDDRGQRNRHRTHGDRSSRHRRRSRTQSTSSAQTQEGTCKEPCVKCVVKITSFRWVLMVLSGLGACCVVTGIVMAALRNAGSSFLFLAIMFIGLGVLLVIVVGVGWKCTPRGHEPLHALFGIGSFRHGQTRERRPRRHRHRDGNWFGGVLYPEFQYRRPPPSYAASMQDYQNQVMQEQEANTPQVNPVPGNGESLPSSPPPSYRSRASTAHSGIHIAFPQTQDGDQPNSRPPTYRSRAPSRRPSLPRTESPDQNLSESNRDAPPPDVSFTGPATVQISNETNQTTASSSLAPNTTGSTPSTAPSLSLAAQGYITPLIGGSQANSQAIPSNTHDSAAVTGSHAPSIVTSHGVSASSAEQVPSLHHRMASEDRRILEQTLQSLEDHMNESEGFTNQGASFDDSDHVQTHVNTHL